MRSILTAAAITAALMCGALLAQSTSPSSTNPASTDPAATQSQPPANQQTSPQSQMQPTAQPPVTSQPTASQPTTGPAGAAANQTPQSPKIAPGSVIPVQLIKTIDAKKAKTGDEVVAKVTMDVKTAGGEILVPKDTKVVGHVTEAQARNKDQKESQMGIAFDHAELKDGQSVNLPMSIQAVIGQENSNAQGGGDQGSSSMNTPGGATPNASASAGRSGMAGSTPQPTPSPSASAGTTPNDSQAGKNSTPRITGQTQGVVGISDLTLASGPNGAQGSVMTSEKNNVKLESGTMLLLKVNQ